VTIWRLAHPSNPCKFVPRRYCSWNNRFDDPQKKYRTLYGAHLAITCLRELLADLRPNPKAIAEFEEIFGADAGSGLIPAGVVSKQWRRAHVLVCATPRFKQGRLVTIEAPQQRTRLQTLHRQLLHKFGIQELTIPALRARQRPVTRAISRTLYEEGYAGISFHSRLDGKPCYAFFEGRASLHRSGRVIPMTENHPDLIKVCGDYTLVLRS
jgi:hypothetical protein